MTTSTTTFTTPTLRELAAAAVCALAPYAMAGLLLLAGRGA